MGLRREDGVSTDPELVPPQSHATPLSFKDCLLKTPTVGQKRNLDHSENQGDTSVEVTRKNGKASVPDGPFGEWMTALSRCRRAGNQEEGARRQSINALYKERNPGGTRFGILVDLPQEDPTLPSTIQRMVVEDPSELGQRLDSRQGYVNNRNSQDNNLAGGNSRKQRVLKKPSTREASQDLSFVPQTQAHRVPLSQAEKSNAGPNRNSQNMDTMTQINSNFMDITRLASQNNLVQVTTTVDVNHAIVALLLVSSNANNGGQDKLRIEPRLSTQKFRKKSESIKKHPDIRRGARFKTKRISVKHRPPPQTLADFLPLNEVVKRIADALPEVVTTEDGGSGFNGGHDTIEEFEDCSEDPSLSLLAQ
ncbi:hypothetical protein JCGZ_03178 [Jatropha curcas]|uniref:Uncharacterized protein n=1 Tax=Jatropha curcas TaxID=180498 RepID=A0A067KY27_JATCU|nr:hypothetical protein JCGZ_03178 [Jatropha curcas]